MKRLSFYFALFFFCQSLNAQTLLIGGATGNGNFENDTTGWKIVNGSQVNKWVVGTAPAGSDGKSMYISSSAASPYAHQYNTTAASYSYFYKDVAIPAGTTTLWLIFDYMCSGEVSASVQNDAFRIWARNPSSPVVAGQDLDNYFVLNSSNLFANQSQWVRRYVYTLNVNNYPNQNITDSYAGRTLRLLFQWHNNSTGGAQPPAAIDNIEMYSSCQNEIFLSQSSSNVSATSTDVGWNTVAGASGYEIRYRKVGESTSVSTYANPIVISGQSSYYTTLSNLSPATSYETEIRPLGVSCNEFARPITITTLTPPVNDSCANAVTLSVGTNACDGTLGAFFGATTTSGISSTCLYNTNPDVWFKFTAQSTRQIIQVRARDEKTNHVSNIEVFSGVCGTWQKANTSCSVNEYSVVYGAYLTRQIVDNLIVGNTYYIRVNGSSASASEQFRICVFNEPAPAVCPQLIAPANNAVLNYGTPQVFKWQSAANAAGYTVKIVEQNGTTSSYRTSDTTYLFTANAGINYTWSVTPVNIMDVPTTCSTASFSTCAAAANPVTIAAAGTTTFCMTDSVKLTTSATGVGRQWFLNGVIINGATSDTIWVKKEGSYTVRVLTGSCYSNASNAISVTTLATPIKPVLSVNGPTTFCQGGNVVLSPSFSVNNQWFKTGAAISNATGNTYTATETGSFYLRVTNASSGCSNFSDTISVLVNQLPATPTISTTNNLTFCAGDSAKLTSSSTTGNQWYRDGNAISGATGHEYIARSSGGYTIKTTVNSCVSGQSNTISVTVNPVPSAPVVTITGSTTFCQGDSVKLQTAATGNLQWYKNTAPVPAATTAIFYAKEAGSYTVKSQAGACVSEASAVTAVSVNALPTIPIITPNGNILGTSTGFASYKWYLNGVVIAGATTNQYTATQSGNFTVEVTNSNGCKALSAAFNFIVTSLNEVNWQDIKVVFYPNPVRNQLSVDVSGTNLSKPISLQIVTIKGQIIKTHSLKRGKNLFSLQGLAAGAYSLRFTSEEGVKVLKFVKD